MGFSGFKDETAHQTIQNDGFFPDLSTQTLVEAYRVPPTFAVASLAVQLKLAMAWANRQLSGWKAQQKAEGYATLADVPADTLGGESVLAVYYRAAVFNECRALLVAPRKIYKRNRRGKMERRKDGKENRKMLMGLGRAMSIAANRRGQGEVSWKDFGMGAIADKHQHGKSETVAAKSEAKRINKDSDYYNPKARVERWLAKELIARGYRKEVRLKNGRVRQQKVAVSWIVQNMTRAEAMAIWQQLTGYDAPDSWTVGVPERAFLGVNLRQSGTMLEELARLSLNRLRSKGKV